MRRKLVSMLLVSAMALSLVACGGSTETEATTEAQTETATEVATEVETETETEVAAVPYVEEQGIATVTDLSYSLPFVASFSEKDDNDNTTYVTYDGMDIDTSAGADTTIIDVQVVDSTEDPDYVDVTFTYETTGSMLIYQSASSEQGQWNFNFSFPGWDLADYYTGLLYPSKATIGDETVETSFDVEWDGQTYPISYTKEITWDGGAWGETTEVERGDDYGYQYPFSMGCTCTYNIHMPKAYDGLTFENSWRGTEEMYSKEDDVDMAEYYLCQPDKHGVTYNPEDYILIRLNDIVGQFEQKGAEETTTEETESADDVA